MAKSSITVISTYKSYKINNKILIKSTNYSFSLYNAYVLQGHFFVMFY